MLKKQIDDATGLGADRFVALDDPADFSSLEKVDVVANTVRGKTAEDLLGKVKDGGKFGARFPLQKAAEAHAAIAKGSAGKILLLP